MAVSPVVAETASVPLPVRGELLTVSQDGVDRPTEVRPPLAVEAMVIDPAAGVIVMLAPAVSVLYSRPPPVCCTPRNWSAAPAAVSPVPPPATVPTPAMVSSVENWICLLVPVLANVVSLTSRISTSSAVE